MQIGEFARICNTKISVLRHYDKEGVLVPDYVDQFTGYRYYSEDKIPVFVRITALKKAGFTLLEIKKILSSDHSSEKILTLFENKKAELTQTLENLMEAEKMIVRENKVMSVSFFENNNKTYAKSACFDANCQNEIRNKMEREIFEQGYQRISVYQAFGMPNTSQVYISCEVIKLSNTLSSLAEDVDIEFEDDSSIVGKWQAVGEYAVKEDFYGKVCPEDYAAKEIFFLPKGKQYWCYSWSKGKLICQFGGSAFVNDYDVEEYNGNRYMFVKFKSYQYRRGGKPTVLVLRQLDNVAYSMDDIAKKDEIDLPFVDDRAVIGQWKVRDFCQSIEGFDPEKRLRERLFFKSVEFKEHGEIISILGDKTICGAHMQTWTKGYILRKWNQTACAYKLCEINGEEYLFIEWKSGDYIYGGLEPQYYVFTRVSNNF